MTFEKFQEGCCGGHLGYWNRRIFSNSESPCLPSASFQVQLTLTSPLGADVI